jgi:hypothetical protein
MLLVDNLSVSSATQPLLASLLSSYSLASNYSLVNSSNGFFVFVGGLPCVNLQIRNDSSSPGQLSLTCQPSPSGTGTALPLTVLIPSLDSVIVARSDISYASCLAGFEFQPASQLCEPCPLVSKSDPKSLLSPRQY